MLSYSYISATMPLHVFCLFDNQRSLSGKTFHDLAVIEEKCINVCMYRINAVYLRSETIMATIMALKLYPLGIQTFERIRREDKLYIDKTEYIYRMAHTSGVYFFLGALAALESRCLYPLSKATLRERKICSRDLPLRNWKRNGQNIQCCTLI